MRFLITWADALNLPHSKLQKQTEVQNLFDPSAKSPRLPKMGDDLSVIQQKGRLLKEKPAEEGQHLAAYIVTVLSRMRIDFASFAVRFRFTSGPCLHWVGRWAGVGIHGPLVHSCGGGSWQPVAM